MAYEDFKDINNRTVAERVLRNKAFVTATNSKYNAYQHRLASMVYRFFDEKNSGGKIKNEIISDKQLAEELFKPINRKFNERAVHSFFVENIWGADLAVIAKMHGLLH